MERTPAIPHVMRVCVQSAGGPFVPGDQLCIAFNDPDVGRVAVPEPTVERGDEATMPSAPVPEAIFVTVIEGCDPYAVGDVLALWFVDPRFARIQSQPGYAVRERQQPDAPASLSLVERDGAPRDSIAAGVRLHWSLERVRRFVGVVDRLFTVDRLGWYRHALAMRLLVPDEILCGDAARDAAATAHLRAIRDAAVETLGEPLLEAFMPNFNVTPEWLDALDTPSTARSFARLRETLESHGSPHLVAHELEPDATSTVGTIEPGVLAATTDASMDAILPLFIPSRSIFPAVTERLSGYRESLIALFGATARSAKVVRLTQMTEPCHALDDRLWQLVGVVGESFGDLTPA